MTVIFVANLSDSVDEALLDAWFSLHGDVHRTQVIQDKNNGLSLRYGFIEMLDRRAAERAIAALVGCEWDGRVLDVKLAANQRRRIPDSPGPEACHQCVYVSAFPYSVIPEDLRDLFSSAGEVKDVRIMMNEQDLPTGVAFVTVATLEAVQAAVATLNGTQYGGRRLTVDPARATTRDRRAAA